MQLQEEGTPYKGGILAGTLLIL
jgi:SNF2 family DNA or RNA helicase